MKTRFPRRPIGTTVIGVALSFVISIGLLTATAGLFQRDGAPLRQLVIADRACSEFAFVSEREACIRAVLDHSHNRRMASR